MAILKDEMIGYSSTIKEYTNNEYKHYTTVIGSQVQMMNILCSKVVEVNRVEYLYTLYLTFYFLSFIDSTGADG